MYTHATAKFCKFVDKQANCSYLHPYATYETYLKSILLFGASSTAVVFTHGMQ